MRILISPWSRKLRNGNRNPKDYPYWKELVEALRKRGDHVIQIGIAGEETIGADEFVTGDFADLDKELDQCDTWISVDNFFHHLAHIVGKPGIVLWGKSDPNIFGHVRDINLIKDRKYLRDRQFDIWENEEYDPNVFVSVDEVLKHVKTTT